MAELIDRQALLEDIKNGDAPVAGFLIGDWIIAQATVDAIPKEEHLKRCAEMYEQGKHDGAIEAETVRHGRWVYSGRRCSECGKAFDACVDYNYCPNCGAKMDATDGETERKEGVTESE